MFNINTEWSIGKIIEEGAHHRDAVHIPVAPVIAGEKLEPGQRIDLTEGKAFKAKAKISRRSGRSVSR